MSKADASGPSGKDDASSGAGNEFAIHEHIGRHLKTMFDEVANEPIPEKLRQLLDTLEHMLFLGTLAEVTENGFWLTDADVHDCREGHAGKEAYIADARRNGVSANRARVFVMRAAVCSLSRLDEVVGD